MAQDISRRRILAQKRIHNKIVAHRNETVGRDRPRTPSVYCRKRISRSLLTKGYKGYETSITYNGIVHTDGCIYFLISAGLGIQDGYYFDFDFTISLTASNGEYYESKIIFRNNTPYSLDGILV